MRTIRRFWLLLPVLFFCCSTAFCVERFPPPEFETDYTLKTTTTPMPRAEWFHIVDVCVLAGALAVASWLVHKQRSRKGIVVLMLFCLAYFGFWRRGCICPIGAIGNISMGIFYPDYAVPWFVVAFFFLPLVFTLFFGRMFCAAVCPLGAIQDLVLLKPIRIPAVVETILRLFVWLYLLVAILLAVTGAGLIICRYDPFVAFFRFSASPAIWGLSLATLAAGVFIGRPYCRFGCPYGLLLRLVGRLSWKRVSITPDECIHCRLCEDACPFGVIDKPTADWPQQEYAKGKRRLLILMVCVPVFVGVCAWLGYLLHPQLAKLHPMLAWVPQEEWATSEATAALQRQFSIGTSMVGGLMGLVIGISLIQYSIFWKRSDYQAQRSGCVGCGRCYHYCPRQRLWLKNKQAG